MWLDDHRTALYRFYDEGGALLYVGITAHLEARWIEHERVQSWWPQVARKTVEWFDSRPPARDAELKAIKDERPIHNVNSSPWAPGARALTSDERTISQMRADLTEHCQRVKYLNKVVFLVDRTKKRKRLAALVSMEFYERALAALGEEAVPESDD
ncbi:GIY-YIG nuclease family protein [Streptomyces asiaticus]|uniref:GIY-YIG nuclease family protein n=1 Tax=Streptomyces asiaticus TaxID=114695 RepID=UPI003F6766C3